MNINRWWYYNIYAVYWYIYVWQVQYLCIVPREEFTARCFQSLFEPIPGHPIVEANDQVFYLVDLVGVMVQETKRGL